MHTIPLYEIFISKMLNNAKSGHTGGSLSAADIITALYFHVLKHDPPIHEYTAVDLQLPTHADTIYSDPEYTWDEYIQS